MTTVAESVRSTFANKQEWRGEMAEMLLREAAEYEFDASTVADYSPAVQQEIAWGVESLREVRRPPGEHNGFTRSRHARRLAVEATEPVARDQAVWSLTRQGAAAVDPLLASVKSAPSDSLAVSALLALSKVAYLDRGRAVAAFDEVASSSPSIEVVEWARLLRRDCVCESVEEALDGYATPISDRDYVHRPGLTYDLTMPLIFQGQAVTRIGPTAVRVDISPHRFGEVFGDAMACIRSDTFESNLVLEKQVPNLHPDGSPHYEIFPFSGASKQLAPGAWHHNYWASIERPFYESGRVEQVSAGSPVIPKVPMTFCRVAITATPDKYVAGGRTLPESVRGIFFGFGHLDVRTALAQRMNLKAGDFQICSRHNPATGKLANTCFYGTFFGKLKDTDGDGRLILNGRPTHSSPDGRLDYHGDGSFAGDPIRPDDW